jgi:hypothetical protein
MADNVFDYNYKKPIVPTNSSISGTAISGVSGYQGIAGSSNQDASVLYNMSNADRKDLAQRLKNAGYRIRVTGNYSDALLKAYSSASYATSVQSQTLNQQFTVRQYLDQEAAARAAGGDGSGGGGGPNVSKAIRISTGNQAADVINKVYQDLIGRGASAAELKKYTKMLQTEQKKPEAALVTKYATSGDVQTATTTGGLDSEQFLIQQISGTDEAKANKVFNYYNAFKDAIGVV